MMFLSLSIAVSEKILMRKSDNFSFGSGHMVSDDLLDDVFL
jgi:hypothetical protein